MIRFTAQEAVLLEEHIAIVIKATKEMPDKLGLRGRA